MAFAAQDNDFAGSFGELVAHVAYGALSSGPMGHEKRREFYRDFVACGFMPALAAPYHRGDISTIATSCGIFVRAVLHHAGLYAVKPGQVAGALLGGWVPLVEKGPGWVSAPARDAAVRPLPPVGAVFYRRKAADVSGSLGHVGVVVAHTAEGLVVTAEGGGGSDGTECKLSKPKDIYALDSLGRPLRCWWDPRAVAEHFLAQGRIGAPVTMPQESASTLKRVSLQEGLIRLYQQEHKDTSGAPLKPDGIVGPKTTAAIARDLAALGFQLP